MNGLVSILRAAAKLYLSLSLTLNLRRHPQCMSCCRNIIRSLRVSVAQILSICRLRNVFLDYSRVSDLHLHEAVDMQSVAFWKTKNTLNSSPLTYRLLLKIGANENVAGIKDWYLELHILWPEALYNLGSGSWLAPANEDILILIPQLITRPSLYTL